MRNKRITKLEDLTTEHIQEPIKTVYESNGNYTDENNNPLIKGSDGFYRQDNTLYCTRESKESDNICCIVVSFV